MIEFGLRLKELRQEKNLSQAKLATLFNVAQKTICAWETSLQEPDMETLCKLANYFEVPTDYLLGRSDN